MNLPPKAHFKRTLLSAMMSVALGISYAPASSAQTEYDVSFNFQQPKLPLAEALERLAQITRISVAVDSDLVRDKVASPVSGDYSVQQALNIMLKGTGLKLAPLENNQGFTLQKASPESDKRAAIDSKTDLEVIVVTANRVATPVNEIARTVSIVGPQQIDEQLSRRTNLGDLLGFTVPGFGAPTGLDILRNQTLRGRDPQYIFDGVPMTFNGGVNIGESPLTKFDPEAIGRIEVVYGPTAIYGAGAPGGVIQFFTQEASEEAFSGQFRQQFSFYPDAPSPLNGESLSWKSTISVSGTLDDFDYVAVVSKDSQNGAFSTEGDFIAPRFAGFSDEETYFAKLGYNFDDNQRLQFTYNEADIDDLERLEYGAQLDDRGFSFGFRLDTPRSFMYAEGFEPRNERKFFSVKYDHADLFGGQFSAIYYDRDEELVDIFANLTDLFVPILNLTYGNIAAGFGIVSPPPLDIEVGFQRSRSDQGKGWRIQYNREFDNGLSIIVGADRDEQDRFDNTPLFASDPGEIITDIRTPLVDGANLSPFTLDTLGTFVQVDYQFTKQLRVSGGFRHESADYTIIPAVFARDYEGPFFSSVINAALGRLTSGNDFDGLMDEVSVAVNAIEPRQGAEGDASNPAYNIGVTYDFSPSLNIYGSFSQALELPGLSVLALEATADEPLQNSRIIEPQRVDNYELGFRTAFGDAAISAAAWYSQSEFGLTFSLPDGIFDGNAEPVRAPKDIWGFEAVFDWNVNGRLSINSTFSWAEGDGDFDVDIDGNPLPDGETQTRALSSLEIQPWKWTVAGNYDLTENLIVNLQMITLGDRDKALDEGTENFELNGYTLFDGGLNYDSSFGQFSLQITNLLNREYLPFPSQFRLGTVGVFGLNATLAPGRRANLTYTYNF